MEQTQSVQPTWSGDAPVRQNLKPERIQEMLLRLPGWRLRDDWSGIESDRQFTSAGAASSFAALACRLATYQSQPVKVRLVGAHVVVTLTGHPIRGCTGGLTPAVFNLAGLIGA